MNWSQADVNILLNNYYYNRKKGQTCYIGYNNKFTTECDFSQIGFSEDSKYFIENAIWYLGNNQQDYDLTIRKFYELEKTNFSEYFCSNVSQCNDTIPRTLTWKGLLGLIYLSDYGFSTSGGSLKNREICYEKSSWDWGEDSISYCKENSWLFHSSEDQWTITPHYMQNFGNAVYFIASNGTAWSYYGAGANKKNIRPVTYLKSDVKMISGKGTDDNPYILGI